MYKLKVTYNHPTLSKPVKEIFERSTRKDFERMIEDIKYINSKQGITHVSYEEVTVK